MRISKLATSIILIISSISGANAQVVFYEPFDEGNGATSGFDNSGSNVAWNSTCPTCIPTGDWFEIKSGKMEGTDTNGPGTWTSEEIDISSCNAVQVSFEISESGTLESCSGSCGCNCVDWVRFEYNVDGTGWVTPAGAISCNSACAGSQYIVIGDLSGVMNYLSPCINGDSTLRIRIAVQTWAANESFRFDNVTVECAGGDPGTDSTLSVCNLTGPVDLFNVLGGTPDGGGTWSGPSVLSNGSNGTFNPTINTPGVYTYSVGTGCTSTADITITSGGYAGGDTTLAVCETDSLPLISAIPGGTVGGGFWSGPSTLSGADSGYFDALSNAPGTYLYIIGSGTSCEDTASVSVAITLLPDAGIDTSLNICESAAAIQLVLLTGGDMGTWTGPVSLADSSGTFNPGTDPAGNYQLTVSGGVCPVDTATVQVNVFTSVDATIDPFVFLNICENDPPVTAVAANTGGTWTASCGSCMSSGQFDPAGLGGQTVTIHYEISSVCSDSSNISIFINPLAELMVWPVYSEICPGDSVVLHAEGIGMVWYNGAVNDSSVTVYDTGFYWVTTGNICGTVTYDFEVAYKNEIDCLEPVSYMHFPNIITPNSDGLNDFFTLMDYENLRDLEVLIYNRWGNQVGEYTGIGNGWDGKDSSNGTYYYVAKATDVFGEQLIAKGHFVLSK